MLSPSKLPSSCPQATCVSSPCLAICLTLLIVQGRAPDRGHGHKVGGKVKGTLSVTLVRHWWLQVAQLCSISEGLEWRISQAVSSPNLGRMWGGQEMSPRAQERKAAAADASWLGGDIGEHSWTPATPDSSNSLEGMWLELELPWLCEDEAR